MHGAVGTARLLKGLRRRHDPVLPSAPIQRRGRAGRIHVRRQHRSQGEVWEQALRGSLSPTYRLRASTAQRRARTGRHGRSADRTARPRTLALQARPQSKRLRGGVAATSDRRRRGGSRARDRSSRRPSLRCAYCARWGRRIGHTAGHDRGTLPEGASRRSRRRPFALAHRRGSSLVGWADHDDQRCADQHLRRQLVPPEPRVVAGLGQLVRHVPRLLDRAHPCDVRVRSTLADGSVLR